MTDVRTPTQTQHKLRLGYIFCHTSPRPTPPPTPHIFLVLVRRTVAEAEQGSTKSAAVVGSVEAVSLDAIGVTRPVSIHSDGSTNVVDVGTIAACRVGGECAAVQRSRSIVDEQSRPLECTISFQ